MHVTVNWYLCVEILTELHVCDYTISHNGNLGLVSKHRMRIREVKAAAAPRPLRGIVSPSGSRDVKRRGGGGCGWSGCSFPDLNLSGHTKLNKATVCSELSQLLCAFVIRGFNETPHTHECTHTHTVLLYFWGPSTCIPGCLLVRGQQITFHMFDLAWVLRQGSNCKLRDQNGQNPNFYIWVKQKKLWLHTFFNIPLALLIRVLFYILFEHFQEIFHWLDKTPTAPHD